MYLRLNNTFKKQGLSDNKLLLDAQELEVNYCDDNIGAQSSPSFSDNESCVQNNYRENICLENPCLTINVISVFYGLGLMIASVISGPITLASPAVTHLPITMCCALCGVVNLQNMDRNNGSKLGLGISRQDPVVSEKPKSFISVISTQPQSLNPASGISTINGT